MPRSGQTRKVGPNALRRNRVIFAFNPGDTTTFPAVSGLTIRLAVGPSVRRRAGEKPHTFINRTTAPLAPFPGVKVKLADQRATQRRARDFNSHLSPPAVVRAADIPKNYLTIQLAARPAALRRAREQHSRRFTPTVVNPATVFKPPVVKLASQRPAQQRARDTLSRLNPPATLTPPPVTPADPVVIGMTIRLAPHRAGSLIRRDSFVSMLGPVVVTGAYVAVDGIRVTLARSARLRPRLVQHVLRPPVLAPPPFVAQKPKMQLASQRAVQQRARDTIARLSPPAVVAPSVTFPGARVKLAESVRRGRRTMYTLRPPSLTVIPIARPVKVTLAPQRAVRQRSMLVIHRINPPVVLAPTVTFPGPRVRIADQRAVNKRARQAQHYIDPPTVVGAFVPPEPTEPIDYDPNGIFRDRGRRSGHDKHSLLTPRDFNMGRSLRRR